MILAHWMGVSIRENPTLRRNQKGRSASASAPVGLEFARSANSLRLTSALKAVLETIPTTSKFRRKERLSEFADLMAESESSATMTFW